MLRGARLLVTGGAGYIGSHAVRVLCDLGADVVVLDSLYTGHRPAVDGRARLIVGDVRDPAAVTEAMVGADAVLHFAALALVGESVREPERYVDVNVHGTRCLAQEAEAAGVKAFVLSSTAATYGEDVPSPITEDQPQRPCNPYGESKAAAEAVLAAAAFPATFLRYFNAAGAMPDGSLGEDHTPETHLIPLCIQAATGQRDQLTVFGADWDTPDGTCVRDYVHVLDLVDAHVLALERMLAGGDGAAFNLGSGVGRSVRQVLDAVGSEVGPVPSVDGARRPGDPPMLVASAERARRELGWSPTRDLAAIVRDAWAWHRSHPAGYAG
ncbi:MAG: UDP-glucose 4-epimerase GalE [Deltaproteobacteria bacterium]|nr:UDP-glucose 4-epimerase GalE [Deltaproteobacteria bacterium]